MKKEVVGRETFDSSSSSKIYEVLTYADGTTSCNCPGWTRRVAEDGSRSCKHTRAVEEAMKYAPSRSGAPIIVEAIKEVKHRRERIIEESDKVIAEEDMVPVSEGVSIEKEIAPMKLAGSVVLSIKF